MGVEGQGKVRRMCLHDGEEEVGSPVDVGYHDGRYHYDHCAHCQNIRRLDADNLGRLTEVEKPVRTSRQGVGLLARLDRIDFGWI